MWLFVFRYRCTYIYVCVCARTCRDDAVCRTFLRSFLASCAWVLLFVVTDQVDHGHRGDGLGERQPLPLLRQPSLALSGEDEWHHGRVRSPHQPLMTSSRENSRENSQAIGVISFNHFIEAVPKSAYTALSPAVLRSDAYGVFTVLIVVDDSTRVDEQREG